MRPVTSVVIDKVARHSKSVRHPWFRIRTANAEMLGHEKIMFETSSTVGLTHIIAVVIVMIKHIS